jgi:hypothetical protein
MTSLSAPLLRGFTVLAIGTTLVLSHITFATAAPAPMQVASAVPVVKETVGLDGTSSRPSGLELAENCYIEIQPMKSVRGKTLLARTHECD